MGIGKRIKELRERAGLTQEELAQRLGVTPSAVGNYEREVSHPKENVLYRLQKLIMINMITSFVWNRKTYAI